MNCIARHRALNEEQHRLPPPLLDALAHLWRPRPQVERLHVVAVLVKPVEEPLALLRLHAKLAQILIRAANQALPRGKLVCVFLKARNCIY